MINIDILRERIHERLEEGGDGTCGNCLAQITVADYERGECTQCGSVIIEDESADEDQWSDPRLDEDENDFTYDNFFDD